MFAFAALSLLAGCANGDFKEVKRYLVRDDIHDWVARRRHHRHQRRAVRLRADRRRAPAARSRLPADPAVLRPASMVFDCRRIRPDRARPARTLRPHRLCHAPVRRPLSLAVGALCPAHRRHPRRHHAAAAVLRDRRARARHRPQAAREPGLYFQPVGARAQRGACAATTRTRRSSRWCARGCTSAWRATDFALERLVLMTPSPQAAQVELALNQLQAEIARYRRPAPSWERERSLASSD